MRLSSICPSSDLLYLICYILQVHQSSINTQSYCSCSCIVFRCVIYHTFIIQPSVIGFHILAIVLSAAMNNGITHLICLAFETSEFLMLRWFIGFFSILTLYDSQCKTWMTSTLENVFSINQVKHRYYKE